MPTRKVPYAPCVECGRNTRRVTGEAIYPHRRDLHALTFYLCECGAYCGAHKEDGHPLGRPAGPQTRAARQAAHEAFDALWKEGYMRRAEAYHWLAGVLRMKHAECHIGRMDLETALRTRDVSLVKLGNLRDEAQQASAA